MTCFNLPFSTEHQQGLLLAHLGSPSFLWRFPPPSPPIFSQMQFCFQSVKADNIYTPLSNIIILKSHLKRVVIALSEGLCRAVSHHYRKEPLREDWSSVLAPFPQTVGPPRSSAMLLSPHRDILLFSGIRMCVAQTSGLKGIRGLLLSLPLVFSALISLLRFRPDLLYLKAFPM